jgi:LPS export ABC transporter protein LptC
MAPLKSNILAGVIFLAVAVAITFWGFRIFRDVAPRPVSTGDLHADLTLQGVELRNGQDGILEWTLRARQAEYDTTQERIALLDPRITYFGRPESDPLLMAASHGEVLRAENRARLWPQVTAISGDVQVEAAEMEYFGMERMIVLSGEVIMTRPGSRVTASMAELDIEGETITLTGGVKAWLEQDLSLGGTGGRP